MRYESGLAFVPCLVELERDGCFRREHPAERDVMHLSERWHARRRAGLANRT